MKSRSPLWLLGFSLFIWGVGEGMFMIFNPLYLAQLGAQPLKIGAILSGFGAAMTLAHVPAGHLADRWGARPLMRWSWSLGLIATLLMASARSLTPFILGLLLYGLTAAVSAPLSSYVTAARGQWSVARALTTTSATFNAGYIIGPQLGGWLGNEFGLGFTYKLASAFFAISTLLVWLLPERRETPSTAETTHPPIPLLRNPRYLGFLGLAFILTLGMNLPQPLTPNYLQEIHQLDYNLIGSLGAIGGLGNVLLSLALGVWGRWLAAYLVAQGAVAFFALLIWRGNGLLAFGLGYFLLGGYRAARSLTTARIRDLIHISQVGLAYALAETVGGSAIILAPMLAGWLYARQPQEVYPVSLLLLAFTALGTLAWSSWEKNHVANSSSDARPG